MSKMPTAPNNTGKKSLLHSLINSQEYLRTVPTKIKQ